MMKKILLDQRFQEVKCGWCGHEAESGKKWCELCKETRIALGLRLD
jgi:primosomal protein N'